MKTKLLFFLAPLFFSSFVARAQEPVPIVMPSDPSGYQPPTSGNDPGGPMVHGVNVVPMPATGIYRVEYTIDPMPGEIFYVEAFFSTDGGNSWSEIIVIDHSMGPPAYGSGASHGGGSHNFHWDAYTDAPGISVPDARVRVVATAGNVPGGFHGPGMFLGGGTTAGGPAHGASTTNTHNIYEMNWEQFNHFVPGGGAVQAFEFPAFVYLETDPGGNWFLRSKTRGAGPDGIIGNADDDYYNSPASFMERIDPAMLDSVAPPFMHSDESAMRSSFEQFFMISPVFEPILPVATFTP